MESKALKPEIIGVEINEIEMLKIMVDAFMKLNDEQRLRAMKYFTDRFRDYVPAH